MRYSRVWFALLAAIALACTATLTAGAQSAARSVTWPRFDVDLQIQPSGDLIVTETQTIWFNGTYHQGYRLVPLDRTTGASQVSVAETINSQSVPYTPGQNQPGTFMSTVGSDGLSINWWFSPTDNASRTFVVRYVVSGALRIYDAGDQLQWRAIYADRAGAVSASTITVHLPADVTSDALRSAWYRYSSGATIGALDPSGSGVQTDGRTVQFTTGQLDSNVGLEVRVQFPHGLVTASPPSWQPAADRADQVAQTVAPIGTFLALLLAVAILAGGGAWLVYLWYSTGRDPRIGSVPERISEPPSDLPAPLAGTLMDEVASEREAVAGLVDLAERDLVEIADEQNPQLVGSTTDVRVTLKVPLQDSRLRDYERVLLTSLFGVRPSVPAEVRLSSIKQQFQESIGEVDECLYRGVTRLGFFVRNPATTRRRWTTLGVIVLSGGIVLAVAAEATLGTLIGLAWLPGVALAVLGGALAAVASRMPRRTQQGALEAARWRAFSNYLRETLASGAPGTELPPRYLPYAVAFGIDRAYVNHLERVGTPPPRWYQPGTPPIVFLPGGWYGYGGRGPGAGPLPSTGGGGVAAPPSPQGWSDALAALLNAASEAMAHGGGSGGWSGGGFGGGGGGGGGSGGFR